MDEGHETARGPGKLPNPAPETIPSSSKHRPVRPVRSVRSSAKTGEPPRNSPVPVNIQASHSPSIRILSGANAPNEHPPPDPRAQETMRKFWESI